MMLCFPVNKYAKHIVQAGENIGKQMSGDVCTTFSQLPSSSCCYVLRSGQLRQSQADMIISRRFSCPSIGLSAFEGGFLRSGYLKQQRNWTSFKVKSFVSSAGHWTTSLGLSSRCQNMSLRLTMPNCRGVSKISWNMRPSSWLPGGASASLIVGVCVCFSSSEPVSAESSMKNDKKVESVSSSLHGKKVYTDYSIIGIPGDGSCLFRSVVHGACLRSGKPSPNETLQKQLADDLRASVADEFVKRREETEWFVEGDFDTYVSEIRKPLVWGGEPELFMASHVLQMPITVYMHDEDSGGLISIAEYGQEYGKENPIQVLYHGFGHYDALQIPGRKGGKSRL